MSATVRVPHKGAESLRLAARQVYYEQLSFWRNRFGATFTVGFSVLFLLLLAASGGTSKFSVLGGISGIQYYVAGFAAYGVMSACFSTLGIQLVIRRETGLLKRLRLSPLPTWALFSGIFLSCTLVAFVQVVLLLGIGRLGYHAVLPDNYAAFFVAILIGVLCFSALGIAISTVVPNEDSAGPMISVLFFVLLFLSGLWYPLTSGSALARISAYFPVRRFILATFAPMNTLPGASPWDWHDVGVMGIWAVVGTYVAFRRFKFTPHRS